MRLLGFVLLVGVAAGVHAAPVSTKTLPVPQLKELLGNISDWIVNVELTSPVAFPNRSIFIYGNMARVLLASYKINGNASYLIGGLNWCDKFVAEQMSIETSIGSNGGYWDTGYREVFIADTGTAVVALTLCAQMQPDQTKVAAYMDSMQKYAMFVTEGCKTPPTNPNVTSIKGPAGCPPLGQGFVIESGTDAGALGDGWYKRLPNLQAYTISTATTGSCAFVEMDHLGVTVQDKNFTAVASNAISWILNSRTPDGRIPYIIHPTDTTAVVFQPITYSTESMIIADYRYPALHKELSTLNSTVHWLAANQNDDGSWGKWTNLSTETELKFSPSGDAQRSPRALSLLQWYISQVESDPVIETAISKYVTFLLNPDKMKEFGVAQSTTSAPLVTGFVGLAVADLIQPWSTFNAI